MTRFDSHKFGVAALFVLTASCTAWAKNVDLSTVPDRATVQLTIYNSEDLTLVRETRKVSFKPGGNPLQFSWANTLIDPTSVDLRFLTHSKELELLDTTFPHDKPQMLYWNVQSDLDGEALIEISYFTSGISWAADYVCVSNADETEMSVASFVRVTNLSGENYEGAQVRLVVGQINLVQKIAELGRHTMVNGMQLGKDVEDERRLEALEGAIMLGEKNQWFSSRDASKEKQIVKEGLSEYFIYTIEGTETIPHGWSKRLRSFEASHVPFKIEYRYREPEYGPQLVRLFLLKNDKDSQLGTTPLPDGTVRLFRDNGRDGLSFLLAQQCKYVPIGDKFELNLGADPDVIFQLVKDRVWRTNLWMRMHGVDIYRRIDDGAIEFDVHSTVAGWDEHMQLVQRIRNFSSKPIQVEIRRSFAGHVDVRSSLDAKNHDYHTVQYGATVPAGKKRSLIYEVVRHEGRNKKQDNVTVVDLE